MAENYTRNNYCLNITETQGHNFASLLKQILWS